MTSEVSSGGRWTAERAWDWYRAQGWICGLNYIPAHAISYTEMWMPSSYDEAKMDREFALAEEIGFNALRVVLPFVVWEAGPADFRALFEGFLAGAARRGLKTVPCFFDDCAFGDDDKLKNPWFGPQPDVRDGWYANGWTPSPGHDLVRNEAEHPRIERYVKDLLSAHRADERILLWDLYNEPGNSELGTASLPLLRKAFAWARELDPVQPLTSGVWNHAHVEMNEFMLGAADVISFHNYSKPDKLRAQIEELKRHGRPLVNTEWLNRGAGSTVADCLPVFREANVGCLHWGLVNGRTQTHLAWGSRPDARREGVWQHDLFHGDHRPYAPAELDLFRQLIGARAG